MDDVVGSPLSNRTILEEEICDSNYINPNKVRSDTHQLSVWCSGYHVCLTRKRSSVRYRVWTAIFLAPLLFLAHPLRPPIRRCTSSAPRNAGTITVLVQPASDASTSVPAPPHPCHSKRRRRSTAEGAKPAALTSCRRRRRCRQWEKCLGGAPPWATAASGAGPVVPGRRECQAVLEQRGGPAEHPQTLISRYDKYSLGMGVRKPRSGGQGGAQDPEGLG